MAACRDANELPFLSLRSFVPEVYRDVEHAIANGGDKGRDIGVKLIAVTCKKAEV
jgi:hypothetical protein